MNNKLIRNSNFELLRIISIFMIMVLHYLGQWPLANVKIDNFNFHIIYFIESACIMGVNCFVLISGYFLIDKDKINIKKIINLLLIVAFYEFIFYFISILINKNSFNLIDLIKVMCPFLIGKRWFVRTYIILFLLVPFLNKSLKSLNKKSFQILIIILILFFSIWPSFLPYPPVEDEGYGIINFILLYVIAAYLKLHFNNDKKWWQYFIAYIVCAICTYLSTIYYGYSWTYNFFTNIIGSVMLFLAFSKLNIKSYKINYISLFVFGIYMIHSDFQIGNFIYFNLLKCNEHINSIYFIVHMLCGISIQFIACLIIDIIRQRLFKLVIDPIINAVKIFNKEIG